MDRMRWESGRRGGEEHRCGCGHAAHGGHGDGSACGADAGIPEGFSTQGGETVVNPPVIHYAIELYYEQLPAWRIEAVEAAIRRRCARATRCDRSTAETFLFEFPDEPITAGDGHPAGAGAPSKAAGATRSTASICCLARSAAPPDPDRLWEPLQQTWGWGEAGEGLARCRGSVLLTDLVPPGGVIEPIRRIRLFQSVLASILEAMPPVAIHWVPAGHFVSPEEFLAAYRASHGFVGLPGCVNVRVLPEDVEGAGGMETSGAPGVADAAAASGGEPRRVRLDTLGMTPLGLPDFQIDATGMPVADVVRVLYNTALYVLESGAVIRDGHTIPGTTPDRKWTCRVDRAWMNPPRRLFTVHTDEADVAE